MELVTFLNKHMTKFWIIYGTVILTALAVIFIISQIKKDK
jgi:hypothetical protein